MDRIVVIGGSAGAIEALKRLASQLPEDFPAPVCVVVHMSADAPGLLDTILGHAGRLPAQYAKDGMPLRAGRFYIAPPDHHLLVEKDSLLVTRGPKENRFRPAVDPLFRSAAQAYGSATIGVVLSGGLDDGTAGLQVIKDLGGTAVVQDPNDAAVPSMPVTAARHVEVDYIVPIGEMGSLLARLAAMSVPTRAAAVQSTVEVEVKIAKQHKPLDAGVLQLGAPSPIACPECHGVLLQVAAQGILRFRCHTGHAYSIETLVAAVDEGIETALWNAVRALEEGQMLLRQLADHTMRHDPNAADDLITQSVNAGNDAETVRHLAIERQALDTRRA